MVFWSREGGNWEGSGGGRYAAAGAPVKPGAHWQRLDTHSPLGALQPLGHAPREHAAPVKPFSHAHVPFWQMPWPEQSAGHVLSEQSNPAVAYARAA